MGLRSAQEVPTVSSPERSDSAPLVVLPFLMWFQGLVRQGHKTMTARTRRYGAAGDVLQGPGCLLELLEVRRARLGEIATLHYVEEGLDSPEEFERVWRSIHPRVGYDAAREVWLHRFRVVKEG